MTSFDFDISAVVGINFLSFLTDFCTNDEFSFADASHLTDFFLYLDQHTENNLIYLNHEVELVSS